jgi:hypothetical protein
VRSVKAVVEAALIDSGVESPDVVARRVVRRLGAHRAVVSAWLIHLGALRSIGYTNHSVLNNPESRKSIRAVPITPEDLPVYVNIVDDGGEK